MPARKNLAGLTFGRWTVRSYAGAGTSGATWLCVCECGTARVVNANSLLAGVSTSCGCWNQEVLRSQVKHGHNVGGRHSPTYTVWRSMLKRCNDPRSESFRNYGGKGITVCDRWNTFAGFLADMGERPNGKTLDRINGSLGYSKENCRWVTMKDQGNNRSNNRLLTSRGKSHTVSQWAEILGLNQSTIRGRLHRGATDEEALRP